MAKSISRPVYPLPLASAKPVLGAYDWGGKVHVAISFYLYGDRAAAAVRDEPLWQEWVKELFPAVASDVAC